MMHSNYIGGELTGDAAATPLSVTNPSTGKTISEIPNSTRESVDRAVAAAQHAQSAWAGLPAVERARHLHALARELRVVGNHIARTIAEEQGKVLSLAQVEAAFTADYVDYMAEWARRIEGEIITSDRPGETILLQWQPLGVVAGVLPWNFPFFLIARKMAPALVTGNCVVIKPSELTPNNAAIFVDAVRRAGLPPGVFNVVYGDGPSVGEALAGHPGVDMVSFTGSVGTGAKIMRAAAPNITKVNLELGGKAPAIVMADADIELAATAIRDSRIINTGQVCNCAERVYVQKKVADQFISVLTEKMRSARFGDPLRDDGIDMGPLISPTAVARVSAMVAQSLQEGATLLTGGSAVDLYGGSFFEPTVLADVAHGTDITRQEIFGPVIPITTVDDFEEAVTYANDSEYGLTSSIYTTNLNTAMEASRLLRFGETYVNRENFEAMQGFHAGARKSGIGGADGKHGLYENMRTHVVYIAT